MTAHVHSVNDTTILQDGDQFVDLHAGFRVAVQNNDVTHVIRSHPWGCYGLHVSENQVVNTALGIALNFVPRYKAIREEGARIAPHYRHDDILLCAPTNYCSIFNAPNAHAREHRNHFEQGVSVNASSSTFITPRVAGAMCGFFVVGAHHYFGLGGAFLAWLVGPLFRTDMYKDWTFGPPTIFVLQKILKILGFKFSCIGAASLFFIYGASSIWSECQQKRNDRSKQILEVLLQISNATCQSH